MRFRRDEAWAETDSDNRTVTIVKLGFAIIVAATVLFCLVDFLEGPLYSLSTKTWEPELRGDKLIGGIEGAVKEAESAVSTVRVASGFLGLASLPLIITPETVIAVKGKLGGFGDLDRGQLIRVAYQVFPDRLVATRVDVLDGWSPPPVMSAEADDSATVKEAESSREPIAAPVVSPPPAPARPTATSTPRPTTSSPRPTLPIAVRQGGRTTAPATERSVPSPTSPPRTSAQDTRRPAPLTAAAVPAPNTPDDPRAGDDALPKETDLWGPHEPAP